MGLALTNKTIDKYFEVLSRLDNNSKKKLISKLTESLETKDEEDVNLSELHGAWEDKRGSDEIIKEIRVLRVDKNEIAKF